MLDVLLESRAAREPRPLVEAALSTLAHSVLIGAVVLAARTAPGAPAGKVRGQVAPPAYLVPPDRYGSPQRERLTFVAIAGQGRAPGRRNDLPAESRRASSSHADDSELAARPRAFPDDDAFSAIEVDSAAVRDPTSAAPAYPPAMLSLNIEGTASVRFVVDTAGRVDLSTVRTLEATNPAFSHAVLEAMPEMKFKPARIGDVPVRQAELQEFKFQLRSRAAGRP